MFWPEASAQRSTHGLQRSTVWHVSRRMHSVIVAMKGHERDQRGPASAIELGGRKGRVSGRGLERWSVFVLAHFACASSRPPNPAWLNANAPPAGGAQRLASKALLSWTITSRPNASCTCAQHPAATKLLLVTNHLGARVQQLEPPFDPQDSLNPCATGGRSASMAHCSRMTGSWRSHREGRNMCPTSAAHARD